MNQYKTYISEGIVTYLMIRKLSEQDLIDILSIETATQFAPWSLEIFQRCFKIGYDIWGLQEQNHVVAFIVFSTIGGEGHILNVCVNPDSQRKGYGKLLLNYALESSKQRGVKMILLEVRRSNHIAIRLYQQLGFIQIGERLNYYPALRGKEDALVFAKDLGV